MASVVLLVLAGPEGWSTYRPKKSEPNCSSGSGFFGNALVINEFLLSCSSVFFPILSKVSNKSSTSLHIQHAFSMLSMAIPQTAFHVPVAKSALHAFWTGSSAITLRDCEQEFPTSRTRGLSIVNMEMRGTRADVTGIQDSALPDCVILLCHTHAPVLRNSSPLSN